MSLSWTLHYGIRGNIPSMDKKTPEMPPRKYVIVFFVPYSRGLIHTQCCMKVKVYFPKSVCYLLVIFLKGVITPCPSMCILISQKGHFQFKLGNGDCNEKGCVANQMVNYEGETEEQ